jgi:hypothetical protein
MLRRLGIACLLLLISTSARAAEPALVPEQLLSATTMLYLRYDGIDAHRKAFDQSVTGELMRGDLGEFVEYLTNLSRDSIGPALLKEQLLEGKDPARLQRFRAGFQQVPYSLHLLGKRGFVVGVELVGILPPRVQLTVIFPGAGEEKNRAAMLASLRLSADLSDISVLEERVAGRTYYHLDREKTGALQVGWWQEGPHIVFILGTEKPERTLELVDKKRKNLLEHPLYKEVTDFKRYETVLRGFLEVEQYLKPLHLLPAPADKLIDQLGIDNLKSITYHLGFEGRNTRSTLSIRVPGKRTGLLGALVPERTLDAGQLPPLPPDASSVYVFHLDAGELFDLAVQALEIASAAAGGNDDKQVQTAIQDFNRRVGIDVRKDLLGSLGARTALYSSPSEGVFTLGTGVVLEVKDEAKLHDSLKAALKALPALLGDNITVRKQRYQGSDVYSIRVAKEGFFFLPSFAVHKKQLVAGLYPQIVQGYLQRAEGKLTTLKPTPLMNEAFEAARKDRCRVVALTVSDPRPGVKQLLSLAPLAGAAIDSAYPDSFDVSKLPNAQVLAEPLFPGVSVVTDDGEVIRFENRSALALPLFDLGGVETYTMLALGVQLFGF